MTPTLGDSKPILILRNHGLLAWGEALPQAFAHLWTIQIDRIDQSYKG